MTREQLLATARRHMWAAWQLSSEELASQAADTLIGLGMLVPEGGAAELGRLRKQVAELLAERHTTNEALSDSAERQRADQDRITELEAQLKVAAGWKPYRYTDPQNHQLTIWKTTDGTDQPYMWIRASDLAIGGEMADVWMPLDAAGQFATALADRVPFAFTDHSGDSLTVRLAPDWTRFEITRAPRDDDEAPETVPVVVLTARIPELRAALIALRAAAGEAS